LQGARLSASAIDEDQGGRHALNRAADRKIGAPRRPVKPPPPDGTIHATSGPASAPSGGKMQGAVERIRRPV
jgi:hypothetical protein